MDMISNAASIMGMNCNPPWENMEAAWYSNIPTQVSIAKEMRWGVVANEKTLGPTLPFGEFAIITSLRHPFDRLISHYYNFNPICKDYRTQT